MMVRRSCWPKKAKSANSVATKTSFSLSAAVRFLRRYGFRLYHCRLDQKNGPQPEATSRGFNAELASPTEAERTPKEREATYASMRGWRGPRKPGRLRKANRARHTRTLPRSMQLAPCWPVAHLYEHFWLIRLTRFGYDEPWAKA